MTKPLSLKYFPVDIERFRRSKRVQAMSGEARGIYLQLLMSIWENGGWLPLNDAILAAHVGVSLRRWKNQYRDQIVAMLVIKPDAALDRIVTNDVVDEVWAETVERLEKKRHQTEPARAQLAAKRGKRSPVTETKQKPPTETVTASAKPPVTEPETVDFDAFVTAGKEKEKKNKALPLQAESLILTPTSEVSALPPREDQPSSPVAVEALPAPVEPIPVSNALLRSPLVQNARSLSDIVNELTKEDRHGKA